MKLEILYEDEYMIACVKPAGVPAQGDKSNSEDMISRIKNYIFDHSEMDEEPYVAAIHRLDRPVGGIMIFAKDPDTAAKLSDMVQDGEITKFYQAVLTGTLEDFSGEMIDYMVADPKTNTAHIVKKGSRGAKRAELYYDVLDEFETDDGPLTYVLIELVTGRHHQIRAQMAYHGAGIWGDTKYNPKFRPNASDGKSNPKNGNDKTKNAKGGKNKIGNAAPKKGKNAFTQIALYASRLEFTHPITGQEMILKSEPSGGAFDAIELEEDLDD